MKKNSNKGFTLLEMTMIIAVTIILLGIVSLGIIDMVQSFDQMEAESYARQIYVKAQEGLTQLQISGMLSTHVLDDGTIKPIDYNPQGYQGTGLSYITSDNPLIEYFIGDLRENYSGSFLIEYDSRVGVIYGVWYASDDRYDYYTDTEADDLYRNSTNQERIKYAKDNKYNLAYYGGGEVDLSYVAPEGARVSNGFIYYEIYEDDLDRETVEYGYYQFGTQESTLQDRLVIGDGYGVLLDNDTEAIGIKIDGTKSTDLGMCPIKYVENGKIMMFPTDWMCANWLDNSAITKTIPTKSSKYNQPYYWNVIIEYGDGNSEQWSYSPYFAKSAVEPTSSMVLPSVVSVRSARQLNAMSWMYSSYFNKKWAWSWTEERLSNTTFYQEVDIDYDKYRFTEYTGREFVGQMPIGTDWGRFISSYMGNGYEIRNCKLLRRTTTGGEYTYAGLFGFVSAGNISDVHVVGTVNNSVSNADYCGILATYVENENVNNCSVDGYTITYQQTNSYNQTTGGNEFANARIGCMFGYIKCPQENNSKYYTHINNCEVKNCTISIPKQMQTTQYYRQYQVGGFVGAIANFESNQSRASHVMISGCSVQATISTKSYGKGTNWCYIGGFAGAIKKYVSVSGISVNVSGLTKNQYSTYYSS